jgi:hypothetical protein
MVTPRPWRAPTPPLAPPVVLCQSRLGGGTTGKPPRVNVSDVLGDTLRFLGVGRGIGHRRLGGQLARVDDQQASLGHVEAPIRVLHGDAADDTLSRPASWRLLPGPPRFFEPQGQRPVLLAPRFHLLAHRTRARDSGEPPHTPRSRHTPSVRVP